MCLHVFQEGLEHFPFLVRVSANVVFLFAAEVRQVLERRFQEEKDVGIHLLVKPSSSLLLLVVVIVVVIVIMVIVVVVVDS